MCCGHTDYHGKKPGVSCCCNRSDVQLGSVFWSKKRKITMLEQTLEGLREEAKDIEELLDELKQEK